jgi:hypothetical protein
LFRNSQRAAYSLTEVKRAINHTSLKGKGHLAHLEAPKSRYWTFEVKAAA